MKPYETIRLEEWPDAGDIRNEARKTSVSGNRRGYNRNRRSKAATRRYLKRKDRQNSFQRERENHDSRGSR